MKTLITIFFIALSSTSFSCGNEYGHNLNGDRIFTRFFYLSKEHRTFDKEQIRSALRKAQSDPQAKTDFKIQSNIALYHMKLGEADKALTILKSLYEKHPEEYIIIANLGTAYELNGQLDEALEMISKGYELNKDSHLGSEWVHIKILEAKIKEKKSPGWLSKNSIITVEELKEKVGSRPHPRRDNHLEFQLRTRVAFTPAPNKVMTNLLETLAEYNVKHGSYENAIIAYTYVLEFTNSSMKKRIISKDIMKLNQKRRESGVTELNFMFKKLIERGEIDPELMLYSVDELADHLQEQDNTLFATQDSLNIMTAKVDSLSNIEIQTESSETTEKTESRMLWGIISGVIGLILGVVIAIMLMNRRKKTIPD